jgi:hypothetical protein
MIPLPALAPKTWLTIVGVMSVVALSLGVWGYIGHLRVQVGKAKLDLAAQQIADANSAAEAARLALVSQQLFNRQLEDQRELAAADAAAREKASADEIEKLRAAQQAGQGSPLSPAVQHYLDSLRR